MPHPAGPRGGAGVPGRIWNPPLRPVAGATLTRAAPLRPPLASCTILARLTRGGVVEGAETALTASIVHIYAKFGVLSIPKQADLLYNLDKSS